MGDGDARGILYPTRLPSFHRHPAPPALADRIRWFWIPQWHLAPGRISRQQILPFPASHLVVTPDAVTVSGPATGASHRDLRGSGWAVGALLRPAALASLDIDPHALRDREAPFDAPDLHRAVTAAMRDDDGTRRAGAVKAFVRWAERQVSPPDDAGMLANAMEDVIADDTEIVRVEQVGERLNLSVRAVQRLARRFVGLPPLAIIRRYRLQEAAQRLRTDPEVTIAQIAADLGYADHAHLAGDFRRILGLTPTSYRRDAGSAGRVTGGSSARST